MIEAKSDADELTLAQIKLIFEDAYVVDLTGSTLSLRQIEQTFDLLKKHDFPLRHIILHNCTILSEAGKKKLFECLASTKMLFLDLRGVNIIFNDQEIVKILENVTGIKLGSTAQQQFDLAGLCKAIANMSNRGLGLFEVDGVGMINAAQAEALIQMIRARRGISTLNLIGVEIAEMEKTSIMESLSAVLRMNTALNGLNYITFNDIPYKKPKSSEESKPQELKSITGTYLEKVFPSTIEMKTTVSSPRAMLPTDYLLTRKIPSRSSVASPATPEIASTVKLSR